MRGMAVLFLLKAVILALFVTPLWDIPDETGHYAIVADLADGRGLPLPGVSVLPPDVVGDWGKGRRLSTEETWNWVAQHPPFYHLLAVPFLGAARAVTDDPHWRYRAPRLLSALSGAAALLVFFAVFWEASLDPVFAFAAASAVGFLPMYSHMSSGTNHDVFLALLCGLAALFAVRLCRSGLLADGCRMGVALALAGITKLSALVVAAALLALAWRWIAARGPRRLFEWLAIAAISASLPALWALRHFLLLGNARLHPVSKSRFDLGSLLAYIRDFPVVDHTFKNFVGLIGWTGTGAGNVRWFQISGPFFALYFATALAAAAVCAVWLWRSDAGDEKTVRWIGRAGAVLFLLFGTLWLFAGPDGSSLAKRLLYSLFAAVPLLALARLFSRRRGPEEIVCASHAIFLFFALAYLVNSWEAYEIYRTMRATNGRYFFAVIPFLGLAFLLPAARLWKPSRGRNAAFLALLGLLAVDETAFFLLRVIPFYRGQGQ
jgi:hypothetical protein